MKYGTRMGILSKKKKELLIYLAKKIGLKFRYVKSERSIFDRNGEEKIIYEQQEKTKKK